MKMPVLRQFSHNPQTRSNEEFIFIRCGKNTNVCTILVDMYVWVYLGYHEYVVNKKYSFRLITRYMTLIYYIYMYICLFIKS